MKALRDLHAFRAEARFSTWLVSIALNEARNHLRRDRAFESLDNTSDETDRIAPELLRDGREVPSESLGAPRTPQNAVGSYDRIARDLS